MILCDGTGIAGSTTCIGRMDVAEADYLIASDVPFVLVLLVSVCLCLWARCTARFALIIWWCDRRLDDDGRSMKQECQQQQQHESSVRFVLRFFSVWLVCQSWNSKPVGSHRRMRRSLWVTKNNSTRIYLTH